MSYQYFLYLIPLAIVLGIAWAARRHSKQLDRENKDRHHGH